MTATPDERTKPKPPSTDLGLVRAYLGAGFTVDEIVDLHPGWTPQRVQDMIGAVLADEERIQVGRRTEDVFSDYVIRTRALSRQLDDVIDHLRTTNQGSALVGAIKAKADLLDRVIERGQDFGIIERKPQQRQILIAKLDDKGLRDMLAAEIAALRTLADGAGTSVHFLDVGADDVPAPARTLPPARPATHHPGRGEFAPPPPEPAPPPAAPAASPFTDPAGVVRRRAIAPGTTPPRH
jgi:hypothetical protein